MDDNKHLGVLTTSGAAVGHDEMLMSIVDDDRWVSSMEAAAGWRGSLQLPLIITKTCADIQIHVYQKYIIEAKT